MKNKPRQSKKPRRSNAFPFLTNASLSLSGRWEQGGEATLRVDKHEEKLHVPGVAFAVLAVLIKASRAPASKGFLPAEDLCAQLKFWTRGALVPEPPYVYKYIWILRNKIAAVAPAGGRSWADLFVEHQYLGYRLSTLPENLELEIVEPVPLPPTPASRWLAPGNVQGIQ
ncbi:MAG TPA: hypothetical protein VG013_02090 [Gemmataceae bacterium]|jgi:hypothetical protein|nr:hypothetical protein [Gemmataceae bacterium]